MTLPGRFLAWLRDTLLRMFPHATRPGLRAIGRPGPNAPVLLSGNFTLTVDRLTRVLRGRDAWLLVADSHGINVWCAAGGGHLTHHDVIAVLRSSGIGERVEHRHLWLPQLAATGVERRIVQERTGWRVGWGPARLEDLPAFLDRGQRVKHSERLMRFPLWERMEMALLWAPPTTAIAAAVLWSLLGAATAFIGAGSIAVVIFAIFAALPRLPLWGGSRWFTYAGGAVVASLLAITADMALHGPDLLHIGVLGAASTIAMLMLSLDLAGTTPLYPSTINTRGNRFDLVLNAERCTGVADCVQVCPRDVLAMDGKLRRVRIQRPDACIRCGACVVQCPEDALFFRFADGRTLSPTQIRATRMNMLGRRAVVLPAKTLSREDQAAAEAPRRD